MTRIWTTLDQVTTEEGELLLLKRGERDYLIKRDNYILMNSQLNLTERALATMACQRLHHKGLQPLRVLIGGLGMGFTLRSALDALGETAQVEVAELNPIVLKWCSGILSGLTDAAVQDTRVTVKVIDVAELIAQAATSDRKYDCIILDLYEGTQASNAIDNSPFYGVEALKRARKSLVEGGVFAVWTEEVDLAFEKRAVRAGFAIERLRPGKGGPRHVVYLGTRPPIVASKKRA